MCLFYYNNQSKLIAFGIVSSASNYGVTLLAYIEYKTIFFSYELRIESMLLKAEFDENMSNLERSVDDMLTGGEGKISNFNFGFFV